MTAIARIPEIWMAGSRSIWNAKGDGNRLSAADQRTATSATKNQNVSVTGFIRGTCSTFWAHRDLGRELCGRRAARPRQWSGPAELRKWTRAPDRGGRAIRGIHLI